MLVLVAVQPDPARRRASVDPAIQRLVAFAHFLPLVPPVALHNLRDQLLGGDLLEVLLAVVREVAVPLWESLPLLEVFVGGSFKPPNASSGIEFYPSLSQNQSAKGSPPHR